MDAVFDFSQETDIKAKLWEKMQGIAKSAAPARVEIGFDSLGSGAGRQPGPVSVDAPAGKNKESKGMNKGSHK